MTPSARTPLPDIPKGHQFPPRRFDIDERAVRRYLDAVADANSCYSDHRLAPPLAAAARALAALLDQIELPFGSLHTGQEFDVRSGVPIDASLSMSGKLTQRSERAGFVISVLEFSVSLASGEVALTGRTTVMAPVTET